jgi:hypothetical protein
VVLFCAGPYCALSFTTTAATVTFLICAIHPFFSEEVSWSKCQENRGQLKFGPLYLDELV